MPAFEYVALAPNGKEQKGVLEGDSARSVRQILRDKRLTPLKVEQSAQKGKTKEGEKAPRSRRVSVSAKDLTIFTRQLSTLIQSGSPLEEALATVARQTQKNGVKSVILSVRSKVLEGHSLASALDDYPRVFPDLYRATVLAGEQSGHLDGVLDRLADYTESRQELNSTVSQALIYPVVLVFLAIAIVVGLLTFVVPQVVQVFEDGGQELPFITTALIASSDFLKAYWWIILGGLVIAALGFRWLMKDEKKRFVFHRSILTLPVIGELIRGLNTARFARTLSILAASSVPILEAMKIAGQVVPNLPMREAINNSTTKVREGGTIAGSLEQSGLFPPMTVHLIASGESSGDLENLLDKAAIYQERETSSVIGTFVKLFETFLILIMGVVVMTIVVAILLPIFEMNQMVG